MAIGRIMLFVGLLATARASAGAWPPVWTGTWERRPGDTGSQPFDVQVAADGTVFAAAYFNRANQKHAALLRFENDGRLAWVREHPVWLIASTERLASGRIALVGVPDSGASVFVRVYDDAGGDLVWEREASIGRLDIEQHGLDHLAETPAGDLLVRLSDRTAGDYVVLRYTADGTALPPWRWPAGPDARATDIAALADGGAVVTGIGRGLGGGYSTVRLDATGAAVFDDLEPGQSGSPLGPGHVAVDADGGIVLAGEPEKTAHGAPGAMVWKLAANGARAWTRALPLMEIGADVHAFALAANGDALVVTSGARGVAGDALRLVRLAGDDGRILWDTAFLFADGFGSGVAPSTVAETPDGRLLLAGHVRTQDATRAHIAEFTADGVLCRVRDDASLYAAAAAAGSAHGWTILASSPGPLVAQRLDASGACDGGTAPDPIFGDGFEAAPPG
ncbi:hypothetical protein [Dokdonella koreensis]|uniref:Uncharacterized protein n=1 Tax=Dokdonella koreensis DS-123 TaxID=1300342 RepID=A0A167H1L7_9GAMM|nr:hypothetical protein [Dokdonella koreensis]ANB18506.1 Hypothetical protein I596_2502 [Dokdonella koreensis DS-123]